MTTRVAVLGGSFNPPHVAHQLLALWALSTGQADAVWLIPCFEHAFGKRLAPFADRCAMCELAIEILPTGAVRVSRVEEELGAPSRTLVTLQHLRTQRPDCELALLIGADILQERESWYRFDEVERLARLLVVGRPGYPSPDGAPVMPDISSTRIREMLERGESPAALLPASVLAYVRACGLYGAR
jgi:nicotinate-nucleotide adenylyltransferase